MSLFLAALSHLRYCLRTAQGQRSLSPGSVSWHSAPTYCTGHSRHHLPPQPACWCLCYFPTASAVLKMITDQCDLEADKGVRVSWSGSPCWCPRGPPGCGSHGCLAGCMNPCSLPQTSFPGYGLHDPGRC